jgi:hypothetical protein
LHEGRTQIKGGSDSPSIGKEQNTLSNDAARISPTHFRPFIGGYRWETLEAFLDRWGWASNSASTLPFLSFFLFPTPLLFLLELELEVPSSYRPRRGLGAVFLHKKAILQFFLTPSSSFVFPLAQTHTHTYTRGFIVQFIEQLFSVAWPFMHPCIHFNSGIFFTSIPPHFFDNIYIDICTHTYTEAAQQ